MLSAIDLFAGGGGLSVGLKAAGFTITHAVELDKDASETYGANHREVKLLARDIRRITAADFHDNGRELDLIAGCPPCQGFTSLTAKYRRDDPRNALIDDMCRLVLELRPRAVMMENVPRLALKGAERLQAMVRSFEDAGYKVASGIVEASAFGASQRRRRFVLLAGLGFDIPLPIPGREAQKVRDAIGDLPLDAAEFRRGQIVSGMKLSEWHVHRRMSDINKARLRAAKPGATRMDLPPELLPACHGAAYKGFANVYGRMTWDNPSPTITAGCTSFSKGRFGHPEADRTITVREAGLLQGFPDDYIIATDKIDRACSIIGNAFPVPLAKALAEHVAEHLNAHAALRH